MITILLQALKNMGAILEAAGVSYNNGKYVFTPKSAKKKMCRKNVIC